MDRIKYGWISLFNSESLLIHVTEVFGKNREVKRILQIRGIFHIDYCYTAGNLQAFTVYI